jgi:hypothetical protein
MKLYELVGQYRTLQDIAADIDHEPKAFEQALKDLQGDIKDKAENVAKVVRELEATAEACDSEAVRLSMRSNGYKSRAESLKKYLFGELCAANIDKVEGALVTVLLRKAPMSCEVKDIELIPATYRRIIPESWQPDRKAMIEAKKADASLDIPGVQFITDKKVLQIR